MHTALGANPEWSGFGERDDRGWSHGRATFGKAEYWAGRRPMTADYLVRQRSLLLTFDPGLRLLRLQMATGKDQQ